MAGVFVCRNCEKYLGLPAMIGRLRYNTFINLKERVWSKICSWKNTFLSQVGKEVLIKAVVQAIPIFAMSVFRLPRKLGFEITSLMARFWWGHKQDDRKIQWRSWYKISERKRSGGLEFRDLECFNTTMLAK